MGGFYGVKRNVCSPILPTAEHGGPRCDPDRKEVTALYQNWEALFPNCKCDAYRNIDPKDKGGPPGGSLKSCAGLQTTFNDPTYPGPFQLDPSPAPFGPPVDNFKDCEEVLEKRLCLEVEPGPTGEVPTSKAGPRICYAMQEYDADKGDNMAYYGCRANHFPCVNRDADEIQDDFNTVGGRGFGLLKIVSSHSD